MRYFIVSLLLAVCVTQFTFTPEVNAQTKVTVIRGKDKVMFRKKTVIDFEENTVDGELVKPEGGYMVNRGRAKFSSLINVRAHFVNEMWKNARKL